MAMISFSSQSLVNPDPSTLATAGLLLVHVTGALEITRARWSRTRAVRRSVSPATTTAGSGSNVTAAALPVPDAGEAA